MRRQPKIKQWKLPPVSYDDGELIDPRRAANYLEDKLPKQNCILVFDGGHAAMVTCQALIVPEPIVGLSDWTSGRLGKD